MRDWGQELEDDLNWREAELALLTKSAALAKQQTQRRTMLRATWALLYAHYEGFCRFGWTLYMEAIVESAPRIGDCSEAVAVLAMRDTIAAARCGANVEVYRLLAGCPDWRAMSHISFPDAPLSKANLWPDVLCKCCEALGLTSTYADSRRRELRMLVDRRNEIAHGRKFFIDSVSELRPYQDAAILAMHEVAVEVLASIGEQRFLK